MPSLAQAPQDGQLQNPFSKLGDFVFHVKTKYNVIHSSLFVKLFFIFFLSISIKMSWKRGLRLYSSLPVLPGGHLAAPILGAGSSAGKKT
jgi:hypothetical protein